MSVLLGIIGVAVLAVWVFLNYKRASSRPVPPEPVRPDWIGPYAILVPDHERGDGITHGVVHEIVRDAVLLDVYKSYQRRGQLFISSEGRGWHLWDETKDGPLLTTPKTSWERLVQEDV